MSTYNALEREHAATLEAMRSCRYLHIVDSALGEPGEGFDELLDLVRPSTGWHNLRLDTTAMEQPLRFSELRVHWQSKGHFPGLSGEYSIAPPEEILLQEPDPAPPWLKDEFHIEFLGQLRHIDCAYNSSMGFVSYLRVKPQTHPFEVWFSAMENIEQPPYPSGYVKLDLGYHAYMKALLLTKGFHGWQFLFTDQAVATSSGAHLLKNARKALKMLPDLFPREDFTELQQRLEARL